MTKISVYPTISSPQGDDLLIGTDIHSLDTTKNFKIEDMFAIGLDTNVKTMYMYDPTLMGYGEMTIDNDVVTIQGAPTNAYNLLVSSATGYISFKKANYTAKLDASTITANRTWSLPDATGTVALKTSATGSFTSSDGKTITVLNGIITSIV